MRAVVLGLIVVLLVLGPRVRTVAAQVEVRRHGDENPVLTIAKATFWGAVTGLLLGGVTALVVEDDEEDVIKWFLVGGTFVGFGFGVYHVMTRPQPTGALLEWDSEGLALGPPTFTVAREVLGDGEELRARVPLFAVNF